MHSTMAGPTWLVISFLKGQNHESDLAEKTLLAFTAERARMSSSWSPDYSVT